ncbi:MAG: 4Fe-4S single cluster domain-containing protein [Planctomycetota bacterium]|nr:4Fe-4S single cluster domain-containing protein [Planctomycetota bacterium]
MDFQMAFCVDSTEAEGPGHRFALWTQGCTLACPGCCNPEMWSEKGGNSQSIPELIQRIQRAQAAAKAGETLEGVSFLGGEPFEQDEALALIAKQVKDLGMTVMVYSGFSLDEIKARDSQLLPFVDLLVAGRYVKELRTTKRRWIGSENQVLHCLTSAYDPNDPRFSEPNHAEILLNSKGDLTVVGFPFDKVMQAFPKKVKKDEL